MGIERRRHPRHPEHVTVHFKRAQFDFVYQSENVSREGLGVITADPRAMPGSEQEIIALRVEVPDGHPSLKVVAQMAWSKKTQDGVELGLHFYLLGGEDKERWDQWIDQLDGQMRAEVEKERARVEQERRKTEAAKPRPAPPGEITERIRGAAVEPVRSSPPAPAGERPRPLVVAVDPAYDRARRRMPRQRMLFLVRHISADALRWYVEREIVAGRAVLTSPPGLFSAGEMVNVVLVHPSTQAEFELLAVVEDPNAGGGIAVRVQLDPAVRTQLGEFVRTGRPLPGE